MKTVFSDRVWPNLASTDENDDVYKCVRMMTEIWKTLLMALAKTKMEVALNGLSLPKIASKKSINPEHMESIEK